MYTHTKNAHTHSHIMEIITLCGRGFTVKLCLYFLAQG